MKNDYGVSREYVLEPIIIKEWRESVLHRVIVPDLIPEGQNNVNSSSKLKYYPHYKQKHWNTDEFNWGKIRKLKKLIF